jgi:hypothetical protein
MKMNIRELNKTNLPIIRIDDSLEKYKKMPLFQEKIDRANETLKKVGLPKTGKSKPKSAIK